MPTLKGRIIKAGKASAPVLFYGEKLSLYGGINPESGLITEDGNPLRGSSVAGKVLVFPSGKGSTVGSYTLMQLKKKGYAPAAIINKECEIIVATGAIIANIPCIDHIDIKMLEKANFIEVDGGEIHFQDK